jgi:hypothetical protein
MHAKYGVDKYSEFFSVRRKKSGVFSKKIFLCENYYTATGLMRTFPHLFRFLPEIPT